MRRLLALLVAALGACLPMPESGQQRSYALRSPPATQDTIAFVGGTVVHPGRAGDAAIERDATVIVRGDRVVVVGPAASTPVPRDATAIDARGKWIIPGLVDTHVHFFQSGDPYTRPDVIDLTKRLSYADEVARIKTRLPITFATWIASGVTTVADVGGPMWNFDVREQAAHAPIAPRVFVAGPLISMVDRKQLDLGDPPIVKIDSPEAARALVQKELAKKPDFVKVWYIHRPGDDFAAQEAIVRATADAAHAAGVRLAVHATELATAKSALRVGADILVHSVSDAPVDDEFLRLARERQALYTPTLFVPAGYAIALTNHWQATEEERYLADPVVVRALEAHDVPEDAMPKERRERMEKAAAAFEDTGFAGANLRKVWDAGIVVTMGTDAGNIGTVHGPSVFREMALMQKAGLTPREVLLAATTNGAKFVGHEKDLGDVAPGMLADLVVLESDPLADTANLSHAFRVVTRGHLFNPRAP